MIMTMQEAPSWVRKFNQQKRAVGLKDCQHFEDWTDAAQIDYSRRYFEYFNAPILKSVTTWCNNTAGEKNETN